VWSSIEPKVQTQIGCFSIMDVLNVVHHYGNFRIDKSSLSGCMAPHWCDIHNDT
jgi:hypothetical protein